MEDTKQRDEQFAEEIRSRFPKDTLLEVQLVWQIAGTPESEAINPDRLHARLIPRGPGEYNAFATETPGRGKIPSEVYGAVVKDFHQAHEPTIKQLGKELVSRVGQRVVLSVAYGGYTNDWQFEPPLTPVMARLDPTDLETLDALIAAGCAPNRADAIRWSLARVRERPTYQRLVEGVRELQALRTQL